MSTQAAGGVDIVLGVDEKPAVMGFTAAGRAADKMAASVKTAGHTSVSSMQAASAAIREMDGNFTNNVRAVERFITTIPGVGNALKAAFPLVGGLAFGAMVLEAGKKLYDFIQTANKMPSVIKQGFDALHLAAEASSDSLKLQNDLLQNHIDKLQGKPQNNLALQLDEARIKADDLAKSLANDADKVKALLEQNKIGNLAGMLTGKAGTSSVSGSVNYGLQEIQHLAYLNRQAAGTPGAPQAAQNLSDKQAYYQSWAKRQLFLRDNPQYATDADQDMGGDQTGNRNILLGFQDVLDDQQSSQAEKNRNAQLLPQDRAAQAAHEASIKAAEADRKAAEEMAKGWAADAEVMKLWQEYANKNAVIQSENNLETFKTSGLSADDNNQLNQTGKGSLERVTALSQSIELNKQNAEAIAESSLQMQLATGQISKMDAARVVATMHTQQYTDAMQRLKDQADYIKSDKSYTSDEARQAALINNQSQQDSLNANRGIQIGQDNQNINPAASSAAAGFSDALNDFVVASRDAASQMRDLTTNTLQGLNQQIVSAMSGQKTNFSNFGAGVFRSIANTGLQKAEGSVLGAVGFGSGKLGTQNNPIWTKSADSHSLPNGGSGGGSTPGISGLLNKLLGTSFGSSAMGTGYDGLDAAQGIAMGGGDLATEAGPDLTDMIPMFATGSPGSISGPAFVGEQGPELFVPSGTGNIIPNHKLSRSGSTGHTINIDASGSTDPAQTRVQVMRGIQAAAPHIAGSAITAQRQDNRRSPSTQRK